MRWKVDAVGFEVCSCKGCDIVVVAHIHQRVSKDEQGRKEGRLLSWYACQTEEECRTDFPWTGCHCFSKWWRYILYDLQREDLVLALWTFGTLRSICMYVSGFLSLIEFQQEVFRVVQIFWSWEHDFQTITESIPTFKWVNCTNGIRVLMRRREEGPGGVLSSCFTR